MWIDGVRLGTGVKRGLEGEYNTSLPDISLGGEMSRANEQQDPRSPDLPL